MATGFLDRLQKLLAPSCSAQSHEAEALMQAGPLPAVVGYDVEIWALHVVVDEKEEGDVAAFVKVN